MSSSDLSPLCLFISKPFSNSGLPLITDCGCPYLWGLGLAPTSKHEAGRTNRRRREPRHKKTGPPLCGTTGATLRPGSHSPTLQSLKTTYPAPQSSSDPTIESAPLEP